MSPVGVEPLDAGDRLRRLLAVLAHLATSGEARLDELAARFDIEEATLVSELELAACCGLPPYSPDQLLELVVDDTTVRAHGLDALRRPPRLTADEGFALAAAARALLAVPGATADGPLARALGKLEAVLGEDRVAVELDRPEHLAPLRRAAAAGEQVEIDYLGAHRGAETTRVVEPAAVVAREGRFYLDAFCHLAGDWRRFQLARVSAVRPTGERNEARTLPVELSGPRAFAGGPGVALARVAVPSARRFVLERVAAGPVERAPDGRAVVPIAVGDPHFLGRLLLALGPGAEVLEPPGLAHAARDAAQRALARYRESEP